MTGKVKSMVNGVVDDILGRFEMREKIRVRLIFDNLRRLLGYLNTNTQNTAPQIPQLNNGQLGISFKKQS